MQFFRYKASHEKDFNKRVDPDSEEINAPKVELLIIEDKKTTENKAPSATNENPISKAKNFFAIVQWLPSYDRHNLRNDLIAGLTVGAVTVPESTAYADLAGLPVEIGLYAALVAPLLSSSL